MSYLVDTNVLSEGRKGPRCHPSVAAWFASVSAEELYVSVLVLGEIRKGIELARPKDVAKAALLEDWLHRFELDYPDRILIVDRAVADAWGRMNVRRTVPTIDGLLAAQANVFGLTLVTRNIRDVEGLAVRVLDPFARR